MRPGDFARDIKNWQSTAADENKVGLQINQFTILQIYNFTILLFYLHIFRIQKGAGRFTILYFNPNSLIFLNGLKIEVLFPKNRRYILKEHHESYQDIALIAFYTWFLLFR